MAWPSLQGSGSCRTDPATATVDLQALHTGLQADVKKATSCAPDCAFAGLGKKRKLTKAS